MKIFVDTNILIDVFSKRQPFFDASATILSMLEKDTTSGVLSAISINNAYYIISKYQGKNKAKKAVRTLLDIFEVITLDYKTLSKSIDSNIKDFEDGIQFFSAISCNADYIITRNTKDLPRDDIPILTPEEFLQLELE